MSYENWKNKAQGFQTVDVRHIQGSFFEGLKKRAEALEVGEGLHIIQTFEPHPLYAVMEGLGYEHHTEQRSEAEFHVWFCRVEKKEGDSSAPFKPLALLNYPMIDEKLGQIAVDFWETTWQSEKRTLPYETRLLLSLTNAVGAGRMRQAARELKDEEDRRLLRRRITELTPLLQETRELAALTAHYYDRSYHRHERYTL